jgi:hypothetical protein
VEAVGFTFDDFDLVVDVFKAALDQLAQAPDADPFTLLFPKTRPKRT